MVGDDDRVGDLAAGAHERGAVLGNRDVRLFDDDRRGAAPGGGAVVVRGRGVDRRGGCGSHVDERAGGGGGDGDEVGDAGPVGEGGDRGPGDDTRRLRAAVVGGDERHTRRQRVADDDARGR